jgi:hypothetical protein
MGEFDTTVGELFAFLPWSCPLLQFQVFSSLAYFVRPKQCGVLHISFDRRLIPLVNTYLYGLVTYQFVVYRYTSTSLFISNSIILS